MKDLGYITAKRTYVRSEDKSWEKVVDRIISGSKSQLKIEWTKEEEEHLRNIHLRQKGSVAGRFLWQLGTRTVRDLGLASLQNCAGVVVNHPIRPFTWCMDMLMLGSGVGYNLQREYVYELPKVKKAKIVRKDTKDADFIVPDSREGWVKLLEYVLRAHFTDGKSFSFSTICIRGKGSPINGFGGVASGPEELCWGMEEINKILNSRAGKKVRPIDVLDIMNIIGYIVVAGNVRRSAQIAIGDCDDFQFLQAKRWDLGNIPKWRAMSNNSVVCNDIALLPSEFWEGYKGNGEPYGLINLGLSQSVGRIREKVDDSGVSVYNPCGELSLSPYETCCLAEVYLPNIDTQQELDATLNVLYKICKHSLDLKCHHPETESIVHKNKRIGIGVTGYAMALEKQKQWLSSSYEKLRNLDKEYSESKGWPESIKLTTVKPSGTLSLLADVTPGVHPGFAHYYIRRIRIAADSPLIQECKEAGYPIEPVLGIDGAPDTSTMVVEFPCSFPSHTLVADDVTAIDQLELVKRLQTEWSDNSVSCTIYYTLEELEDIKRWLSLNYNTSVKTCSFLLKTDHGFAQAPLEKITKEEYEMRLSNIKPLQRQAEFKENEIEGVDECQTGACPIK